MTALIILWIIFFVSHSVLADNTVKSAAQRILGNQFRFYRLGYNLLSLIFMLGIGYILVFKHEPCLVFVPGNATLVSALALCITGALISAVALLNYDLSEFAGFKQLSGITNKPGQLVVSGMNHYVRHPLYFGLLLLTAGYFLYKPTQMNLVTLVLIYLYIFIGAKLEEKKLVEAFGEEYRVYQNWVKMLVPYLF